ncbi:hypothetical protein [Neobacillus niacini]|uniref:hypothetical protein n=1 Tax=Neobacillus niacini TaxID=86668 RepID=UPI003982F3DF
MFVCSNHVRDALKLMFLPHIKLIAEEESFRCHLCKNKAKYKLFSFGYIRKKTKEAM